jgi:hypothetical protein
VRDWNNSPATFSFLNHILCTCSLLLMVGMVLTLVTRRANITVIQKTNAFNWGLSMLLVAVELQSRTLHRPFDVVHSSRQWEHHVDQQRKWFRQNIVVVSILDQGRRNTLIRRRTGRANTFLAEEHGSDHTYHDAFAAAFEFASHNEDRVPAFYELWILKFQFMHEPVVMIFCSWNLTPVHEPAMLIVRW